MIQFKLKWFAFIFAFVFVSAAFSLSAEPGKTWPDEHSVVRDSGTGYEYIRLTTSASEDSVLYFTGNALVPADNILVFASKRDRNKWQLFKINLKSFVITQLTDLGKVGATSAVVCAKTREAFFFDSGIVKAVNLRTYAVRTITSVPEGYSGSSLSVTDDGKFLAYSISEKLKLMTTTDKIYSDMDEHFNLHPWSALLTGKSDGTGWHEAARQQNWISHTMISPVNPAVILYCHEGRWDKVPQRLWLAASDGSYNKKLRPEETPELSIGHEFWFADGIRVGYQLHVPKKGAYLGIVDIRTGDYTEYPLPLSDGHNFASSDVKTIVGDGSAKNPYLSMYVMTDGKFTAKKLLRHNSDFSRQEWHPHPRISPDNKTVFFTSVNDQAADINMMQLP